MDPYFYIFTDSKTVDVTKTDDLNCNWTSDDLNCNWTVIDKDELVELKKCKSELEIRRSKVLRPEEKYILYWALEDNHIPEEVLKSKLFERFGINPEEFEDLFESLRNKMRC